ncbi:polymer-forming cytoskeletal protein [bacterium]|nr:polymer-forming cytoskeletal protein [bacterium]
MSSETPMKPAATPKTAAASKPAAAGRRVIDECLVGVGSRFDGTLVCGGLIRVEGECSGRLESAGTIVVAAGAAVNAELKASEVIVAGRLEGSIEASRRVDLVPGAKVRAEIRSRAFRLEEGAWFRGTVAGYPEVPADQA